MKLTKIKNKKGAIELSIGTIVIIVLAMSMLILGLVLVRTIFSSSIDSVKQIDQGVKNEINKLFSENQDRKLILYPDTRLIKLKQGSQDEGFAVSVRNVEQIEKRYRIAVTSDDKGTCHAEPIGPSGSVSFISGNDFEVTLPPSSIMETPRHVRLSISPTAPSCTFSLKVTVTSEGSVYQTDFMEVQLIPK